MVVFRSGSAAAGSLNRFTQRRKENAKDAKKIQFSFAPLRLFASLREIRLRTGCVIDPAELVDSSVIEPPFDDLVSE